MKETEFRTDIFSTPLWIAESNEPTMRASIEALSYAFKDKQQGKETGLVSAAWSSGEKSANERKKNKYGITSFNTENLVYNADWNEASTYLLNMAGDILSVENNVDGMKLGNMWTTIYPEGGFVPEHIHSCFSISGVFYVKAKPNCGDIVFKDPSWVAKTMNSWNDEEFPRFHSSYRITPTEGMMVLFPSWLPHSTRANESGDDRIIVSFNLDFGKLNQIRQLHEGVQQPEEA